MTDVLVCEQWPLRLDAAPAGWFAEWALRRRSESSAHITASYAAYAALKAADPEPYGSVFEAFGGLGCQALIIRHLLTPQRHEVWENHPAAVEHLRRLLTAPGEAVTAGDAYTATPDAELVALDFGDLTVHKADTVAQPLLQRVFAAGPRAVVLTDIAGPKLHLHRRRYETLLNHPCDSYPAYLQGLAGWLHVQYGYRPVAIYEHRWSALLALTPGPLPATVTVSATPARPEGLRIPRDNQ